MFKKYDSKEWMLNTESGYCSLCNMKLKPKMPPLRFIDGLGRLRYSDEYIEKYNSKKIKCDKCGTINTR